MTDEPVKKPDEPLDMDGEPEWSTLEAERDYWKGLALSYGAQITAMKHTLATDWTAKQDVTGQWFVEPRGKP